MVATHTGERNSFLGTSFLGASVRLRFAGTQLGLAVRPPSISVLVELRIPEYIGMVSSSGTGSVCGKRKMQSSARR